MSQTNIFPLQADIVSRFLSMTEADDAPYLYRKWAGISLVAGALERRVWANVGFRGGEVRQTFPNLYIFLVGAPGVGKYIVNTVREFWRGVIEPGTNKAALHVSDNNMTKASMVDSLSDCVKSYLPGQGSPYEYHSLLIAAEEFGVFLPAYDLSFIAVLNEIYNAPSIYSEKRRHGPAREVSITNPLINILGGLQPAWMSSIFPPEAWGMGLFSRTIMIYAASGDPTDPFAEGSMRPSDRRLLSQALSRLSMLFGEIKWTGAARAKMRDWHMGGGHPAPAHSKLEHYNRRRTLHAIKLAMVSSVSRTNLVDHIEDIDVARAIEWLLEAEALMPDIFRSMIGQSDFEIMDELYNHLASLYAISKSQPIHDRYLTMFFARRVPSEKISKILEAMDRTGMISRIGGTDTYIPKNRKEFKE